LEGSERVYVNLNCIVVDADSDNREEMVSFLTDHGGTVVATLSSLERLTPLLRKDDPPQLVMVNLDPNAHDMLRSLGPLIRQFQSISFFVMSEQSVDVQLVMEAMHYGVKEFIPLPADSEKLLAGIERVSHAQGSDKRAKIIQVIPTIGGCGATSIACNVAASLARNHKTVLLDLDLIQGAVATSFDLNPRYTIADVMSSGDTLDRHLIDNALAVHASSGLFVLSRPEQPEDSLRINRLGFNRLLNVITRQFDYIVIDAIMSVDPLYMASMQQADVNVLVLQLSVPSVRNAERFIGALRRMGVDRHNLKIVINRYEKRGADISPEDVSKTLGVEVSWMIPNDFRTAIDAINFGEPLVLRSPRAEVSTSYGKLVQLLNGRH
jgi:pilus assembly protein CpaE